MPMAKLQKHKFGWNFRVTVITFLLKNATTFWFATKRSEKCSAE